MHDKLHFKIAYPSNLFHPTPVRTSDAGSILVALDGLAKRMIAAFDYDVAASLQDYPQHLLNTIYSGAAIHYAPPSAAAGSCSQAPATAGFSTSAFPSPATDAS